MKKINILILSAIYCFGYEQCTKNSNELIEKINEHPKIKINEEMIKGAEKRIDIAYTGYLPTIEIESSIKDEDKNTGLIRIEQPIWTGGKITSKYNEKINEKEELKEGLNETEYQLKEELINLLNEYKQSETAITELKIGLNNLYKFKEILNRRLEAGVSPESDIELLNSRIYEIKNQIINEENNNSLSKKEIENITEEKICNINLNNNMIKNNSLEENIEEMINSNSSLKKIEKEKKTIESGIEGIKAKLAPDVTLRGEHKEGNLYYKSNSKEDSQNLIYLNVSAKFGLSVVSEIEEKKIKITELEYKRKNLEKQLTIDLFKDYTKYKSINERLEIIKSSIISSKKVLESYERLFIAGKRSWLDVANSLKEEMNYRIELSNLEIEKRILSYKIELKTGKLTKGE